MSELDRYCARFRHRDPELYQALRVISQHMDFAATRLRGARAQMADVPATENQAPTPPPPAALTASGANGIFSVTINNPQDVRPPSVHLARAQGQLSSNAALTPVQHNLQSANDLGFSLAGGLIDYGISPQQSYSLNDSGASRYFRLRSSYDGRHWNGWQVYAAASPGGPTLVSAGTAGSSSSDSPTLSAPPSTLSPGLRQVALTMPDEFTVSGSPASGASGTLAVTKATQDANKVYAGPTTGAAAEPAFRALVADDLPGTFLRWTSAPAASDSAGTAGEIAYDDTYLYVCVSTNRWGRIALEFWGLGGFGIDPYGVDPYGSPR